MPSHQASAMTIGIRSFHEDDLDAVFSLYGAVFGDEPLRRYRRRWNWQFSKTPAASGSPMKLWVADRDGDVVGYLAAFPTRLKVLDQQFVVYHDCDLIVAPSARRQGLAQRLIEAYDDVPHVLSSCLTYAAANGRIRQRIGYQRCHIVPIYVRPHDLPAFADFLGRQDHLPRLVKRAPLSWSLKAAAAVAQVGVGSLNALKRPRSSSAYSVERATVIGPEFDTLWDRCSTEFPVAVVRDRAFVQWRFQDDPSFINSVIVARDHAGTLVGYVVVRVSEKRGLKIGRIVDLFCPPRPTAVAESLLRAALDFHEQQEVGLVTCLGLHPSLRKIVKRFLYLAPARLDQPAWLLWKGEDSVRSTVYSQENWHVSFADSDIGFGP